MTHFLQHQGGQLLHAAVDDNDEACGTDTADNMDEDEGDTGNKADDMPAAGEMGIEDEEVEVVMEQFAEVG